MMPSKKSIKDLVNERRAFAKKALSSKKVKKEGPSQSSSFRMLSAPQLPPLPTKDESAPSTEQIPYVVRECCIKKYKVSTAFKEDATGIAACTYIFDFEDWKSRLGWMLP